MRLLFQADSLSGSSLERSVGVTDHLEIARQPGCQLCVIRILPTNTTGKIDPLDTKLLQFADLLFQFATILSKGDKLRIFRGIGKGVKPLKKGVQTTFSSTFIERLFADDNRNFHACVILAAENLPRQTEYWRHRYCVAEQPHAPRYKRGIGRQKCSR